MSTYPARHAPADVAESPQRRLLVRGGLAAAAATAAVGTGAIVPAMAATHPTVRLGSRGSAVAELQRKLSGGGYSPGAADGIFGSRTRAAVIDCQGDHRLVKDGICGPRTWAVVDDLDSGGGGGDDPEEPSEPPTGSTLKRGDRGSAVKDLQIRLRARGYWHSGSDGIYGQTTEQAVMAVQKVYGLTRDGVCGPATMSVVRRMGRKVPRSSSGTVIEIELRRQIMIFVVNGQTQWVFNTSTGKAGWRTPPGRFTIFRQIDGMRYAPLGKLWRPKYFNGGIALHGSTSIPGYPASHGCTRLSNLAINYIWSAGLAPIGRRVWVY
ncbi:L,D-transpeptidase family protein [Janibacter anophelis]|uniref:L,D-transpeptidase family protein n=1 Tax=Janibacter anophelis TaxID=319054 RepID=UPI003F7EE50F